MAPTKPHDFPIRPRLMVPYAEFEDLVRVFSAKEIPKTLRDAILIRDERAPYGGIDPVSRSIVPNHDYYTPLLNGKEWFLELTLKHQPKTGKLLMDGGPLVLLGHPSEPLIKGKDYDHSLHFRLGLEACGNMVFFNRMDVGHTPSDEGYEEKQKFRRDRLTSQSRPTSIVNSSMPMCTPIEISQAYFKRFWGMGSLGIDLMPFGSNGTSLTYYLKENKLAKKYSDVLNERFKNIDLAEQKKPVDALSVLSDSFGMWSSQCDLLFLESYREHSPIYYVRNREFENIRILDNYVEGLDNYYYYLLTGGRQDGPFDFMPYTKPFKGR